VPGGKMGLAMEIILSPIADTMMENQRGLERSARRMDY